MNGARRWLGAGLAMALTVALAGPATAVDPFASAVRVAAAGCRAESVSGDVARDARGVTRGFAAFEGRGCGPARTILWFAGREAQWRRGTTPYRGVVMAATTDGAVAVVLFANADGTFLGRRRADGTFAVPRKLSASGLTGAAIPTGDVIAAGGRFWAVWSEQVGPGGEFAQTELFQSQDIGQGHFFDGVMPRTRITWSRDGDDSPTLVAEPSSTTGQTYALAWSRNDGARGERGDLLFARASGEGRWTMTRFATTGYNTSPDLFATRTAVWLAWARDGIPVAARRSARGWSSGTTFDGHRTFDPAVSAGGGEVLLAWTGLRSRDVVVAQRSDSGWASRNLTPDTVTARQLLGVTTAAGRATVVYANPGTGRVLARTQR